MSTANNVAQSNYDVIYSDSASPAARVRRVLTVHNPYEEGTWFQLLASQGGENYRVFLETTELWLEPDETREVVVMFEYTEDNKDMRRESVRVQIDGFMDDPRVLSWYGYNADAADLVGGVDVVVFNGWKTAFEDPSARKKEDGAVVSGAVVMVDNNTAVSQGSVVVVGRYGDAAEPSFVTAESPLSADGSFEVTLDAVGIFAAQIDYLPGESSTPYARSASGWLQL